MNTQPIVFLHVPKTAGQTIHNELVRLVGGDANVSPVRVHTQAGPHEQLPQGYSLYSGHIDWATMGALPRDRFAFTVLRDPKERIASFYYYLRKEARKLSREALQQPENLGKRQALEKTPDEYFFGGDEAWQTFVRDHYENFYCNYFASQRMRGRAQLQGLPEEEVLERAVANLGRLQGIYSTDRLERLEEDVLEIFGERISVAKNYVNAGDRPTGEKRWPRLIESFENHESVSKLEGFVSADEELLKRALT